MENITSIRKALGENLTAEMGTFLDEVERDLKSAETNKGNLEKLQGKFDSLEADYKNQEVELGSVRGKHNKASKLITDLQSEVESRDVKIKDYDDKLVEFDELKGLKVERDNETRASFGKWIEDYKDKPVFDKIKPNLKLPTDENTLEKMAIVDIYQSMAKIKEYSDAGFLEGGTDSRTGKEAEGEKETTNPMLKSFKNAFSHNK